MISGHKNKAMDGTPPKRLKCVRECWAPGIGAFAVGDVIENRAVVEQLDGNPNFQEINEEA